MKKITVLFFVLISFLWGSYSAFAALETPVMTITTSGNAVAATWSSVAGATGYTLYYAPYPSATPIQSIDMGSTTSISTSLPIGTALYVAVKAYNNSMSSDYSNINNFTIQGNVIVNMPEMVSIPGGTFQMGDIAGDGNDDETPVHWVTVSSFDMGKYEITNAQFCEFMNDGYGGSYYTWQMSESDGNIDKSGDTYTPKNGKENHPVVYASYNAGKKYCVWLSQKTGQTYRLPTEAEWEYTCRAGTTTKYWWGDNIDETQANWKNKTPYTGATTTVGSYQANPFDLYDMIGNVSEWVSDYYDKGYYSQSPALDPTGPTSIIQFVSVRGGHYNTEFDSLMPASRRHNGKPGTDGVSKYTGFRVVRAY